MLALNSGHTIGNICYPDLTVLYHSKFTLYMVRRYQ